MLNRDGVDWAWHFFLLHAMVYPLITESGTLLIVLGKWESKPCIFKNQCSFDYAILFSIFSTVLAAWSGLFGLPVLPQKLTTQ